MSHYYTSMKYTEASAQLELACEWLDRIGVNYSRTRVNKYRKLFASAASHQLSNTLECFHQDKEWINAVYEVAEITRIFKGLNEQNSQELVQRLRKSLKGHHQYVLDNSDNSGSNFSLELSIASKFVLGGYSVDFGDNADVATNIGDIRFFVECKRLKSANQIEKRISEGLKQLVTRYQSSQIPSMARGIIILSISKVINENLGQLDGEKSRVLADAGFKHIEAFISTYQPRWQREVDQRTLGAAVILDVPGRIGKGKLITCHLVALNNSVVNSNDYKFLQRIANEIFDQPTGLA